MARITANNIYPAKEPQYIHFPSRRSVVHSTNGMVACTQPLAAQAGLDILRKGGNCADAAVAVAAALNVTEHASTGIGGDMFALFYDNKTKKVRALNGSGRAPAAASVEKVRESVGLKPGEVGFLSLTDVHSITVPGAAAGWVDTLEKFGSGKVSLQEVLEPAIRLAEDGFPISEISSRMYQRSEKMLRGVSSNFKELLKEDKAAKDGCRAPMPGEILRQKELAQTFRALASGGKKAFYEGEIAERIVKAIAERDGFLTADDLKHHGEVGTEEVEPISIRFRGQEVGKRDEIPTQNSYLEDGDGGLDVWECPPNGQGIVALIALALIEELEKKGKVRKFGQSDHNSAEYLHVVISVLQLAFSVASPIVSDPTHETGSGFSHLLSPEFITTLANQFKSDGPAHLDAKIEFAKSDTVQFSVIDSEGNGISFINSLYGDFGSGVIPKGTGFALHGRGSSFSLEKQHPNCIAGRKRPYHTIIPCVVTNPSRSDSDPGSLHTLFGVMGAHMQPQGHVQVLLNLLVFGLNPQSALDAPRICVGSTYSRPGEDRTVFVEEGIAEDVVQGLAKLGHEVQRVPGWQRAGLFGRGQVIRVHIDDNDGENTAVYSGGSDPRGDGCAIGW